MTKTEILLRSGAKLKTFYTWFLPVVATLIGIVVGASLNHILASQRASAGRLAELQADAYEEFFHGQALLQRVRGDEARQAEAREIIKRATIRIAIWSPPEVISAINDYWRTYKGYGIECATPEKNKDHVQIYQRMRAEVLGKNNVPIDDKEMVTILLGCTWPDDELK